MGACSALRLRLTDEQPALCVEPRGPGSLSRKKKEVEDQSVGSFTGGFSRRREEQEEEKGAEEGEAAVTVL